MDYDDDGILDFISGSYDPGDIYLFRGAGDGKYEKVQKILDKSGQPVVHHPKEFAKYQELKDDSGADDDEALMARVASFGSWVAPVDWEFDGDLDLLIGSFGGELYRRVNEGTRSEPVYGNESIQVEADGEPIKVHAHANPVVADWNSDGLWDLVVSSGDGSVGWYQNLGSRTEPKFGPRQPLVAAAAESKFLEQNLNAGDAPVPGVRAQICVTDYNLDGLLDLIVGDYSDINWLKELDGEEKEDLQALLEQKEEFAKAIGKIREAMVAADLDESTKSELEEEFQAIADDYGQVDEKCKQFCQESRRASFVWLYLRSKTSDQEPPTNASASASHTETEAGSAPENGRNSGPVTVAASIEPARSDGDARFQLSVQIDIEPGWHVYASTPDLSASRPLELDLDLPDDVRAIGKWQRPKASVYINNSKMRIHHGTATFVHELEVTSRDRQQMVRVDIHYQVCNDKMCLRPTTITKKIPLP